MFQFIGQAERAQGNTFEWVIRAGKNPVKLPNGNPLTVRFEVDMGPTPPVFQRGYLANLACVAEVAR